MPLVGWVPGLGASRLSGFHGSDGRAVDKQWDRCSLGGCGRGEAVGAGLFAWGRAGVSAFRSGFGGSVTD